MVEEAEAEILVAMAGGKNYKADWQNQTKTMNIWEKKRYIS